MMLSEFWKMETNFIKLEEQFHKQISSMSDQIEYLTQELAVAKGSGDVRAYGCYGKKRPYSKDHRPNKIKKKDTLCRQANRGKSIIYICNIS